MAGRPSGSKNKPKFADNVSVKERVEIVAKCLELAKKGDVIMLKFVAEQIYGKAPQPLVGGDKNDNPIAILKYVCSDNSHKKNNADDKKAPGGTRGNIGE